MALAVVTASPIAPLFLALVLVRQTTSTTNLITPAGTIHPSWTAFRAKVLATILAILHHITSLAIDLIAEMTHFSWSAVNAVILLTIYTTLHPWRFIFSFTFMAETFQAFATCVILQSVITRVWITIYPSAEIVPFTAQFMAY